MGTIQFQTNYIYTTELIFQTTCVILDISFIFYIYYYCKIIIISQQNKIGAMYSCSTWWTKEYHSHRYWIATIYNGSRWLQSRVSSLLYAHSFSVSHRRLYFFFSLFLSFSLQSGSYSLLIVSPSIRPSQTTFVSALLPERTEIE